MLDMVERNLQCLQKIKSTMTRYKHNPTISSVKFDTKLDKVGNTNKKIVVTRGKSEIVLDEIPIVEAAEQLTDKAPHIKFYGSMEYLGKLSKSGIQALLYLLSKIQFDDDRVIISPEDMSEKRECNIRTAHRGMKELIELEIIFKSTMSNIYWLNVNIMFRGNRRYLNIKDTSIV